MQTTLTSLHIYLIPFSFRAVFKFDESNRLKAAGTGKDFKDFKASFSNEDRGFGYIRINVSVNAHPASAAAAFCATRDLWAC